VTPEIAVETLCGLAHRSYERGRLTLATRAALLVVPLTAICARETEEYTRCGAIGALLLVAAIGVRWRQWRGVQAVHAGLLTGVLPMTAALVLCRFAGGWPPAAAVATCTSAGLIAGALAARPTVHPASLVIAGLAAALGCVGIGLGTAVGGVLGVAAGAVVRIRTATSS
jgi:hypothetical protein